MAQPATLISRPRQARRILLVTLLNGVMPLVLVLSLGSGSPLLFGMIFTVALLVSVATFSRLNHWRTLRSVFRARTFWNTYRSNKRFRRSVRLSVVARLGWPLYALALLYVEPTVVAISMGIVPLFSVFNLARAARIERGAIPFEDIRTESFVLVITALAGLALTVLATSSTYSYTSMDATTLVGLGAALLAALCQGLGAYNISLGIGLAVAAHDHPGAISSEPAQVEERGDSTSVEFAATLVGLVWSTILALPVLAVAFACDLIFDLTGTGARFPGSLVLGAIVAGGAIIAGELIIFRRANIESTHIGINAIGYLRPVLALAILGIGSRLDVVDIGPIRLDYLTIGTLTIIAVNVLLNVESERRAGVARSGFRMFIFSILLFGSFVYLRDDFIGTERLLWSLTDYFALLALSATVFTLILSFRISRLTNRTDLEDSQSIKLYRRAESLARAGVLPESVLAEIRQLDIALDPEVIARCYSNVHAAIGDADGRLRQSGASGMTAVATDAALQDLREAQVDIDILVQSRQHGRGFAEILAVAIFAALTIVLTLMVRPAGVVPVAQGAETGFSGFIIEMFSVMFGATICFLMFHLFDLRRERRLPVFARPLEGGVQIAQRDTKSRSRERAVAIGVGVAVTAIMISLLYHKWLSAGSLVW